MRRLAGFLLLVNVLLGAAFYAGARTLVEGSLRIYTVTLTRAPGGVDPIIMVEVETRDAAGNVIARQPVDLWPLLSGAEKTQLRSFYNSTLDKLYANLQIPTPTPTPAPTSTP